MEDLQDKAPVDTKSTKRARKFKNFNEKAFVKNIKNIIGLLTPLTIYNEIYTET